MLYLILFCYAFLAATSSVLGVPLEDGQYRISIPNSGAPWYLKLLGPGANATFEFEATPGSDVWTVDTTDLGLRTLTSNEHQVHLGYVNTNPGTPLQGIEIGSTNPDTFNIVEGPAGWYYVRPSSSSAVAVGFEHPPTADQGGTAIFRSININPPTAFAFTPVEPA